VNEVEQVNPHRVAEMADFHKIHAVLAMLNFADKRLATAQTLSHVYLA